MTLEFVRFSHRYDGDEFYSNFALSRLSITISPGTHSGSVNGPLRPKILSRCFLFHKIRY
jgi:hypothetical protein